MVFFTTLTALAQLELVEKVKKKIISMNRYIITIMALLLWGCQKKQMQLPQVEDTKITSVEDYSQVYLPYDPETGQGKLNANGLISSTNWIFHIDKRNN